MSTDPDPGRRQQIERLRGLVIAAAIPVALCVALAAALQALTGVAAQIAGRWVAMGTLQCLAAYVGYRCAVAFVYLQFAPIYPRASFYGKADIAPEDPARPATERTWMHSGCLLAALSAIALVAWLARGQPAPVVGLLVGLAVASPRALRLLTPEAATRLEESLRARYLLYLRSFGQSHGTIALATLRAAKPLFALMIVSPRRIESRSPFWYGLSILQPLDFGRLVFWSTVDTEWDRVVASCMARSLGIVIDCAGIGGDLRDGQGLSLELGISLGFVAQHPTAYTIEPGQVLPAAYPVPALLRVRRHWGWLLRHHRRLVERLRAITHRSLPAAEQAYLDAHYARLEADWRDAMVGAGLLALRQGRADPGALLLARRAERAAILKAWDEGAAPAPGEPDSSAGA